ncbi:MAG: hypothetical protein KJO46_06720 [Gammaproteobacteria bacterium]|nr:hypothetical protein [Gammaproteobacteria bacterium]
MTVLVASAPGKAVLSGEYAVLDGAPAVCMALNRRARVSVREYDGDWHRVSAPGYTSLEGRFLADGAAIDWLQGEADYRLVDSVWWALGGESTLPSGDAHLSIELDTRAFSDAGTGSKIGIGSSAAMTTALAAVLCQSVDVEAQALKAHRAFQHGAGSGIDIATSVRGGLVVCRNEGTAALAWPSGLSYRLIWSGVASSTTDKLLRLEQAKSRASRAALKKAAAAMADAWQSAQTVMAAYPRYIDALRQFSVDHGLGVFDAGHDRLVDAASSAGLVYKPCGAGGGDIGILLGPGEEPLDEFIVGQSMGSRQVLDCGLDPRGVELEQQ